MWFMQDPAHNARIIYSMLSTRKVSQVDKEKRSYFMTSADPRFNIYEFFSNGTEIITTSMN